MITWQDVKEYLKNNYTVQDEGDGYINIILSYKSYKDGRNQVVMIKKMISIDQIWLHILSPIGNIKQDDLDIALEILFKGNCGGLVKDGDTYFVKDTMPIAHLSIEELVDPIGPCCIISRFDRRKNNRNR